MGTEDRFEKALSGLDDNIISIHEFNLTENRYQLIRSNIYIDILSEAYDDMQDKLNYVMRNITDAEQIDQVLEFSDLSTLSDRMGEKNSISMKFLGKVNGWCLAKFMVLDRTEDGEITQVLHTVERI